jgi:hypothetical protein
MHRCLVADLLIDCAVIYNAGFNSSYMLYLLLGIAVLINVKVAR